MRYHFNDNTYTLRECREKETLLEQTNSEPPKEISMLMREGRHNKLSGVKVGDLRTPVSWYMRLTAWKFKTMIPKSEVGFPVFGQRVGMNSTALWLLCCKNTKIALRENPELGRYYQPKCGPAPSSWVELGFYLLHLLTPAPRLSSYCCHTSSPINWKRTFSFFMSSKNSKVKRVFQ